MKSPQNWEWNPRRSTDGPFVQEKVKRLRGIIGANVHGQMTIKQSMIIYFAAWGIQSLLQRYITSTAHGAAQVMSYLRTKFSQPPGTEQERELVDDLEWEADGDPESLLVLQLLASGWIAYTRDDDGEPSKFRLLSRITEWTGRITRTSFLVEELRVGRTTIDKDVLFHWWASRIREEDAEEIGK
ncbi:hypothetical protein CALVIDRAFT_569985 [Calocera viscosa TUFC12733]|nr:hypothetical protein CALVIDRAFT_569985 [Calocera viscosa TUFC12733]